MESIEEASLRGSLALIAAGGGFALVVNWLALQAGFYRQLPVLQNRSTPSLGDVIFVFLTFFFIQLIVVPLSIYLWLSYEAGAWQDGLLKIPAHTQIWLNGLAMWTASLAILITCYFLRPTSTQCVISSDRAKSKNGLFSNLCFGAMSWFICYPIVFTLNLVLTFAIENGSNATEVDQVAVKLLKKALDDPSQLAIYFTAMVFIAPFLEEFMFRGILQRWLIAKVGRWSGILLASFCFAMMHYAGVQGIFNLQILPSLFVLSCYLGYLYEREESLWAPIGLHSMFNFVSACMVVYEGK